MLSAEKIRLSMFSSCRILAFKGRQFESPAQTRRTGLEPLPTTLQGPNGRSKNPPTPRFQSQGLVTSISKCRNPWASWVQCSSTQAVESYLKYGTKTNARKSLASISFFSCTFCEQQAMMLLMPIMNLMASVSGGRERYD